MAQLCKGKLEQNHCRGKLTLRLAHGLGNSEGGKAGGVARKRVERERWEEQTEPSRDANRFGDWSTLWPGTVHSVIQALDWLHSKSVSPTLPSKTTTKSINNIPFRLRTLHKPLGSRVTYTTRWRFVHHLHSNHYLANDVR